MRNNNLLKLIGVGALLYGAYKLGEYQANRKKTLEHKEHDYLDDEESEVLKALHELRSKPNKTKNDKFNIDLLGVKLKQLYNNRK